MALSSYKRAEIIRRLTEGESIRAVATAIEVSTNTVQRIKKDLGIATPARRIATPLFKTKKMTCKEYATHMGEDYCPFKHGYGMMRSVEVANL